MVKICPTSSEPNRLLFVVEDLSARENIFVVLSLYRGQSSSKNIFDNSSSQMLETDVNNQKTTTFRDYNLETNYCSPLHAERSSYE